MGKQPVVCEYVKWTITGEGYTTGIDITLIQTDTVRCEENPKDFRRALHEANPEDRETKYSIRLTDVNGGKRLLQEEKGNNLGRQLSDILDAIRKVPITALYEVTRE